MKYAFVKESIDNGLIKISQVNSCRNSADADKWHTYKQDINLD